VNLLSTAQMHSRAVEALGLDPNAIDLDTPEAVSAALRRAAGLLCPCAPTTLKRAVTGPLERLSESVDRLSELVEETLEALVASGDLMEIKPTNPELGPHQRLVFAGPPSFVRRTSGSVLVLGVAPDGLSPLGGDLTQRVEYVNHARWIHPRGTEDLGALLDQLGLLEVSAESWLKAPKMEAASLHVDRLGAMLEAQPPPGEPERLLVIEPTEPVTYYKGRWSNASERTGRFVGRRPQAYGADLWCFVELARGQVRRLLDFPLANSRYRGCDEAWCLQMALDAVAGHPQCFQTRKGVDGRVVIEFFSPVPLWSRRRWDFVGEPVAATGCLFAYSLGQAEADEEMEFARKRLWLTDRTS